MYLDYRGIIKRVGPAEIDSKLKTTAKVAVVTKEMKIFSNLSVIAAAFSSEILSDSSPPLSRSVRATKDEIQTDMEDALFLCDRKALSLNDCARKIAEELDEISSTDYDCFVWKNIEPLPQPWGHYHASGGEYRAVCSKRGNPHIPVDESSFKEWVITFLKKNCNDSNS